MTSSCSTLSLLDAAEGVFVEPAADGALMASAAGGDRGAFAELVRRHEVGLVSYLARLTGSRDRAEDLAQETFIRLWSVAGQYRESGQFTAYLFRIATNLLRSEERRVRRWRFLSLGFVAMSERGEPLPAMAATPPNGDGKLLADERRRHLLAAVASLPLSFRVPLVLAEIEGWPLAEIGALVGCREGTVKSRLFRARRRLREQLAPYWRSAPGQGG